LALFFWIIGYGALLPGWFLAGAIKEEITGD
jgi:hypothetical protein